MFEYEKYIRAISEDGSFTKAAERLYVTQPALSIAVKKIEDELGRPLFVRGKKQAILTEDGRRYLEAAHEVAEIERRFLDRLKESDSSYSGTIRVGGAGICMHYVIPEILTQLRQKYPGLKVEVTEESFYTLRELLLKQELDLVLDSESYHANISHVRLFPNMLLYAVPKEFLSSQLLLEKGMTAEDIMNRRQMSKDSPLIGMQEVADIPYLSLQSRNELYSRAELLFSHYNCRPKTAMHFNQQLTCYRYAEQGFGAAFIGDTLIKALPSDKLLFYLFDYKMPERWISIAYKKDEYLSKGAILFIEMGKSIYKT